MLSAGTGRRYGPFLPCIDLSRLSAELGRGRPSISAACQHAGAGTLFDNETITLLADLYSPRSLSGELGLNTICSCDCLCGNRLCVFKEKTLLAVFFQGDKGSEVAGVPLKEPLQGPGAAQRKMAAAAQQNRVRT